MSIGFIGPGKVGVSLARYFSYKNIEISGFYGHNPKSLKEACNLTNSTIFLDLKNLITESNIIVITTPDDTISEINKQISKYNLTGKSIFHTSGSLSSDILSSAENSGASIYSIHPMFAFSNKFTDLEKLNNIYFSVEGKNVDSNSDIIKFMNSLGNKYFIRDSNSSAKYHLANVIVSNLALSLFNIGIEYLQDLGLSEKDSFEALYPLILGNIENIKNKGFNLSLTGPVSRGDISPVEKHLSVLKDKDIEIYKNLSMNLLNLKAKREFGNNEDSFVKLLNSSEKFGKIYKILGGIE
ncbi:Rossmann-like and DUF2520 domain-containing protein [Peptacetobacter sp.]|uniref:Rossmann-like and DUF2520 domain-containing protein n=1 Tax=Peptacetobacter sp. TaxID=2991975 RepID=UPI00262CCCB2|nr:Rossmann-like and DUF2520 domain-containing protein [Peptacetobacter sp.]